ncbi:unnamed protein product [Symbiodinium sp. CCMP2456]|nr:unnamed protein product [Symbiodinium sp. CCMP2456]
MPTVKTKRCQKPAPCWQGCGRSTSSTCRRRRPGFPETSSSGIKQQDRISTTAWRR